MKISGGMKGYTAISGWVKDIPRSGKPPQLAKQLSKAAAAQVELRTDCHITGGNCHLVFSIRKYYFLRMDFSG